jgi:hypothetical protein
VVVLHWATEDATMCGQIDHVRLQWLGFKAPTSATRPDCPGFVLRRRIDISRPAQLVSSTCIHFRIRRNQKWPGLASRPWTVAALDRSGSDPSLHQPHIGDASPSRGVPMAPQQPCRARQRKKPGVRQPARATHFRRQAWQRPYPTAPSGSVPVGGDNRGDRRLRRGSAGPDGGECRSRKREAPRK